MHEDIVVEKAVVDSLPKHTQELFLSFLSTIETLAKTLEKTSSNRSSFVILEKDVEIDYRLTDVKKKCIMIKNQLYLVKFGKGTIEDLEKLLINSINYLEQTVKMLDNICSIAGKDKKIVVSKSQKPNYTSAKVWGFIIGLCLYLLLTYLF